MRLTEIENKIKDLVEKDVNNPEVYTWIHRLAHLYLMRNKLISRSSDAEEVAHIAAEDLYMKVYKGGVINSWLGYLSRSYHAYIRTWKKMNGSEIIDTTSDHDLNYAIVTMCHSSGSDGSIYRSILDRVYIESLIKVVDEVIDISHYLDYTKESLNARLSIILSLCEGKFISYGLSEADSMYVNMLYNLTLEKINTTVKLDIADDTSSMSLMQLFTLSNYYKGKDDE